MIDMASGFHHLAGFGGSALAVVGGVIAQAPNHTAAETGLYVGAGGLAAALALLVSSLGDKVGPHAVAVVKLWVDNRAVTVRLTSENQNLAEKLLEQQAEMTALAKRLTDAETAADLAREKANAAEDIAIALKARADATEGRIDGLARKSEDNTARLDAGEIGSASSSGIKTTTGPTS